MTTSVDPEYYNVDNIFCLKQITIYNMLWATNTNFSDLICLWFSTYLYFVSIISPIQCEPYYLLIMPILLKYTM